MEKKEEKKTDQGHKAIKAWSAEDRPREKLAEKGAEALTKSELLAILIHNGTRSKSAVQVGQDLLDLVGGNLDAIAKMNLKDLQKVGGIGFAKAVTIMAAIELSKRKEEDKLTFKKQVIKSSGDIVDYLQLRLQDSAHERFYAVFLNRGMRIIAHEQISSGGITGTVVDVRIIAKRAIELGATNIIVSHNHPSGNINPSEADKVLTKHLKEGLKILDIDLIDHIIVSHEGFHSFSENGDL